MKQCKWVVRRDKKSAGRDCFIATLRAGLQGKGRKLNNGIIFFADSALSCSEAERLAGSVENAAINAGYIPVERF